MTTTCGCGTEIPSETAAQRHAKTCGLMGWPHPGTCPDCGTRRRWPGMTTHFGLQPRFVPFKQARRPICPNGCAEGDE